MCIGTILQDLWTIFRSPSEDRSDAQLVGYYGFLHLNPAGFAALEARTLSPAIPRFQLARSRGGISGGRLHMGCRCEEVDGIDDPGWSTRFWVSSDMAGSRSMQQLKPMSGLNRLKGYGFNGASDEDDSLGDLFHFYIPGEADTQSNAA